MPGIVATACSSRSTTPATSTPRSARRLQGDFQVRDVGGRVELADADDGDDTLDGGILAHRRGHLGLQAAQLGERDLRLGLQHGGDKAGVLRRQEALRNDDVQPDRDEQRQRRHDKRRRLVAQHPLEAAPVALDDGINHPVEAARDPVAARSRG